MSDIAARNKRNRGAGKRWEKDIEDGGRALGIDTERTRDSGEKDQGDLAMRINGQHIVVEAKNAALQPGPFVEEALIEAKHYAEKRKLPASKVHPVVFIKRRGKGGLVDHYALTTVGEYLRLARGCGS